MPDPFLSEIKYLGGASVDFIEVTVDAGTDVSDLIVTIYQSNGSIRSSNSLAGLTPTTQGSKDIYVIVQGTPSSFNGVALSNAVALSDSSGVYAFVSFNNTPAAVTATEGPADGLTSDEIGSAGRGASLETTDGGATYIEQLTPTPGSVPCLTKGAKIATQNGDRLVETLVAGDMILTFDRSYQPLQKVMRRKITGTDMHRNAKLRPVRITASSLGQGLPREDLLVSRQHRMLVASPIAKRMFGTAKVLVSAIKLTALPGVYVDENCDGTEYFHLVFDQHEVVFAEGAPTESLLLGPGALDAMSDEMVEELGLLLPELLGSSNLGNACFLVPTNLRQKRLIERHAFNRRPVLSQRP